MTTAISIPITHTTDTTPAVAVVPRELSGPQWCSRYPGINTIDELAEPFQTGFREFLTAMQNAGMNARITAIYRPPERSYLMHFSKAIATGTDPRQVKAFEPRADDGPVLINWVHKNNSGDYDADASKQAAEQMVIGYGTQGNPVAAPYASRHNSRPSNAVDTNLRTMTIPANCVMEDKQGNSVRINKREDLYTVARTYGVYKLLNDLPHWSNDGH